MEEDQEHKYLNNVLLFRLAISNHLKNIAESVSTGEFLDILTLLKSKPNVAQKLHEAMIKELHDSMIEDLKNVLEEGNLRELLEKVAMLSDANSSVHEDAWRPPGNVTLHLRSLDAKEIQDASDQLAKQVNEIEEENTRLMEIVAKKRLKIFALRDSITQSLNSSPITIMLLQNRLEQLEKCIKMLDHK
ncbi:polyamine-modulated factor 1-like [Colletes gigas]|uniref:polyamine-modulated factor 1-like n=1 Tax=Colletes gigas TaxID=935657 RepID=UPI001C9B45FE|nr:polyamine-modulated factor 1-like [Colletes gigas]